MNFIRTGTLKPNAMQEPVTINPVERVRDIFFDRLDYFLYFIAMNESQIIKEFAANLVKKYQGLVQEEDMDNPSEDVIQMYADFENLYQHPDLFKASLKYLFHLMQLEGRPTLTSGEVDISMEALIRAWTYPSYYLLEALIETSGRRSAVKLYKRYITHYYLDHPAPDRDQFVSLEQMLEKRLSGDTTSSEWIMVHTMLEEGKYAFKNENCPTCVDMMVDLPDVEIKYLVCCYGDYEKFRANYGDHIILTMEHTLMEGDPYCSRVLHDTRIDYDIRHPQQEFWDNFLPGKEEEALKHYKQD